MEKETICSLRLYVTSIDISFRAKKPQINRKSKSACL